MDPTPGKTQNIQVARSDGKLEDLQLDYHRPRILIAGGGLSASLIIDRIKKWCAENDIFVQIVCVDANGAFHRGNVYQGNDVYLNRDPLNFPKVGSRDRRSIREYCKTTGTKMDPTPSREVTGNYIERMLGIPDEHVSVMYLQGRVTDLNLNDGLDSFTAGINVGGQGIEQQPPFDAVFLCLGSALRQDFKLALAQSHGYAQTLKDLRRIVAQKTRAHHPIEAILVAGDGASSIDFCHRIHSCYQNKGKEVAEMPLISIASRRPDFLIQELFDEIPLRPTTDEQSRDFRRSVVHSLFNAWIGGALNHNLMQHRSVVISQFCSDYQDELGTLNVKDRNMVKGILNWMLVAMSGGHGRDLQALALNDKLEFLPYNVTTDISSQDGNLIVVPTENGHVYQGILPDSAGLRRFNIICDARSYSRHSDPVTHDELTRNLVNQNVLSTDFIDREYGISSDFSRFPIVTFGPGVRGLRYGDDPIKEDAVELVELVDRMIAPKLAFIGQKIRQQRDNQSSES